MCRKIHVPMKSTNSSQKPPWEGLREMHGLGEEKILETLSGIRRMFSS